MTTIFKVSKVFALSGLFCLPMYAIVPSVAQAQCAGCGADINMSDRAATAREAEAQRVEKYDTPIRPDPLGNALIGGAVTGSMKGAAAGALSAIRGAGIGTAIQQGKEKLDND